MVTDVERTMFQSFILPGRKQRYLELLGSKHGRDKIRASLDHFKDLDPRYARRLRPQENNAAIINNLLRSHGAPHLCHLMSSSRELDSREMPLLEALQRVVGHGQGTSSPAFPADWLILSRRRRASVICACAPDSPASTLADLDIALQHDGQEIGKLDSLLFGLRE